MLEITRWIRSHSINSKVHLESTGIRNQVTALIAGALEPDLFSEIVIREGMPSLGYLLEKPVEYQEAAELFCLDLYKEFDLDRFLAMAGPTKVIMK